MFQIAFTINTSASNFKAPNLSDFDVYSGPNQSSSMQIVNGNMSQSISLSYMLSAKKEGKFTIGAASIVVNGTKLESNVIPIEVKAQRNRIIKIIPKTRITLTILTLINKTQLQQRHNILQINRMMMYLLEHS